MIVAGIVAYIFCWMVCFQWLCLGLPRNLDGPEGLIVPANAAISVVWPLVVVCVLVRAMYRLAGAIAYNIMMFIG